VVPTGNTPLLLARDFVNDALLFAAADAAADFLMLLAAVFLLLLLVEDFAPTLLFAERLIPDFEEPDERPLAPRTLEPLFVAILRPRYG
jgi:hypothetical protein